MYSDNPLTNRKTMDQDFVMTEHTIYTIPPRGYCENMIRYRPIYYLSRDLEGCVEMIQKQRNFFICILSRGIEENPILDEFIKLWDDKLKFEGMVYSTMDELPKIREKLNIAKRMVNYEFEVCLL